MREFDNNGLMICEFQAKLFEASYNLDCSSPVFIRRFVYSTLANDLDNKDSSLISFDVIDGLNSISKEFGSAEYGIKKYSKEALFWIGYMYRYISYTREKDTKFVAKLFAHQQLNNLYFAYHTQDPEWCIRSLLEINNLSETIFDNNEVLKKIIKEKGNY